MFAVTKQAGQCMFTAPDVCKTPTPPGAPVPLPYPNFSQAMLGNPATTKVRICSMPALNKGSKIPTSNGDEPGVAGGVISNRNLGQTEFIVVSRKVKLQGKFAVRLSSITKQNHGNTIGVVAIPSQSVVLIMS